MPLNDLQVVEATAEILDWVIGVKKVGAVPTPSSNGNGQIPEGRRHDRLLSLAGSMRGWGADPAVIEAALGRMNLDYCNPPLPDGEVATIARSMGRYEQGLGLNPPRLTGAKKVEEERTPLLRIPASQLRKEDISANWLWWGCLAKNSITLLAALWKVGKTTLASHLLKAFEDDGSFCGLPVKASRVLYVTEEHEGLWADRRDRLGLKDHIEFIVRPFKRRPSEADWVAFVEGLVLSCRQSPVDLIFFDPLVNLWPVRNENDASEVGGALLPLHGLAEEAGIALVHHIRKSDGAEATAARGSGALSAFVDTILELRRHNAADRSDRRRVLTGFGRYVETPEELVIELTEDGNYVAHGDRAQVMGRDLGSQLAEVLPVTPPGITYDQIVDRWPSSTTPTKQVILKALHAGRENGIYVAEGRGVKGSPYLWWRPLPPTLAGQKDSYSVFPYRGRTETESNGGGETVYDPDQVWPRDGGHEN